jgi:hypothetical protein
MEGSIVVLAPVLAAAVAFSSLDGATIGAAALVVALVAELAVLAAFDGGLAERLVPRRRVLVASGVAHEALDPGDRPV